MRVGIKILLLNQCYASMSNDSILTGVDLIIEQYAQVNEAPGELF